MKVKYRITRKMNDASDNPYTEGTREWHIWIDISVLYDGLTTIDLNRLCEYHSMNEEYYTECLSQLCEDGYLELIHEQ